MHRHPHQKPHHPHLPLACLLFVFVFALGMFSVHESATWLDIRTGAWIIAHHMIPRVDQFSYTVSGRPWTTNSWLADVLFWAFDRMRSPEALIILKSALAAFAFACLLPLNPASPLVAAAVLAGGAVFSWPGLVERPGIFDLPLLALLLRLLRPRLPFNWSAFFGVCGIEFLWANLHGETALVALGIIILKAGKASLRSHKKERFLFLVLPAGAALAFAANPHGFGLISRAFSDSMPLSSWWPSSSGLSAYFLFAILPVLSCAVCLQQEFVLSLATAALLALGLVYPPGRPLAALAGAATISLALGHFIRPIKDTPRNLAVWALAMAALFSIYWAEISRPLGPARGYGSGRSLAGALSFLSENGVGGRVFNEPDSGSEILASGRDVFIDRRPRLYDSAFLKDAENWSERFFILSEVYHFDYALIENRRVGYPARILDEDPAWAQVYADDSALIYARRSGADAWLAPTTSEPLRPNKLWPDALDSALMSPHRRGPVLAGLDSWIARSPDAAQPLLWKAYALGRLGLSSKAGRWIHLAESRPTLWNDPELLACSAFLYEQNGDRAEAVRRYRRSRFWARLRGDALLEDEVLKKLSNLSQTISVQGKEKG